MLVSESRNRCARNSGPRSRSNGSAAKLHQHAAAPPPRARLSATRQVLDRKLNRTGRHRSPAPARRPPSQTASAMPRAARQQLAKRPLQRRDIQRPPQPHRRRQVIGRPQPRSAPETTAAPAQTTAQAAADAAAPQAPAPPSRALPPRRRHPLRQARRTVGASNRARSGSSTPKRSRTRAITRIASSECPPRSKKLSWTPTRSSRSTSAPDPGQHLFLGRARRHVFAARKPAPSGAGSARRSSLPFGVSGSASSPTYADGTM